MNRSKSFQIQTTSPWPLVLGLDISARGLKYVLLRHGRTGLKIEGFGKHHLDLREAEGHEKLRQILKTLFRKNSPMRRAKVVLGVEGPKVILKRESFPALAKKELAQTIYFTIQQEIGTDEEVGQAVVDFMESGADPDQADYTRYLCMGMAESLVEERLAPLTTLDVVPDKVFPSVAAMTNLLPFLPPASRQKSLCFLDMGAQRSMLVFVKDGQVDFHREIVLGGDDFTKAITGTIFHEGQAIQFDAREAEDFKFRFGYPLGFSEGMTYHGAPLSEVGTMIRPVVERLIGEIQRSMDFYREKFQDREVEELYLVGGGARTKHLSEVLADKTGVPTAVLPLPDSLRVSGGKVQHETFQKCYLEQMVALSLALESSPRGSLLPPIYKKAQRQVILKRALQWAAVAVLSVMSVWSYSLNQQLTERRLAVAELENHVTLSAKNTGFFYAALQQRQQALTGQLADLSGRMDADEVPLQVLRMLSHVTPKGLALSNLELMQGATAQAQGDKKANNGAAVTAPGRVLKLTGWADNPPSDVGIILAQFIVDLEKSGFFSAVEPGKQLRSSDDNEFRFTLTCTLR